MGRRGGDRCGRMAESFADLLDFFRDAAGRRNWSGPAAICGTFAGVQRIFLRLIKVIVAPLIFGTLVTGIAGHGNLRSVGRIGVKSLVYFEVVTTLALFLGLGAIHISRAGEGLTVAAATATEAAPVAAPLHSDILLHIFPENLAKSVAENQILQVAVFSILFGIALARLSEAKRAPMLRFCESLTATMFAFTNLVMYFAPVGVGAAMAYTVGHMGNGCVCAGEIAADGVRRAAGLSAGGVAADRAVGSAADREVRSRGSRAGYDRICDERFGSSVASRDGIDGRVRGAAAHRGVRDSGRIQLQPGRIDVVFGGGVHFCGAGGRHSFDVVAAAFMVFTLMVTSKGVAGVPRAVLVVLLATAATFHLPRSRFHHFGD